MTACLSVCLYSGCISLTHTHIQKSVELERSDNDWNYLPSSVEDASFVNLTLAR